MNLFNAIAFNLFEKKKKKFYLSFATFLLRMKK